MLKLLILIAGGIMGGAGVAGWLLASPDSGTTALAVAEPNSVQGRIQIAKERFREARAVGARSQDETQVRLQQRLDAYRAAR